MSMTAPLAAIFGCAGTTLSADERAFFKDADPLGFILFARNIDNPAQVRALINDLRDCVGRQDAPVLVDQEGGRVQRLGPPHWRKAPNAETFANLHSEDTERGRNACALNTDLLAAELADLGFSVDCVPVLDIPQPNSDLIIGDRAAGKDVAQSAELGQLVCERMLAGGITPVIKHIPGHGRATVDSHLKLPVVDASADDLRTVDFAPFKAVSAAMGRSVWAMTAHIIYETFDMTAPCTTSAILIADIVRGEIGFDGFLVSDDLSMKALSGSMVQRTKGSLDAGCDAVLHCNGEMEEMTSVAGAARALNAIALERFAASEAARANREAIDPAIAAKELDALLQEAAA